ncbi:GNAT family N-acetyltransferase [Mucilaginibacter sp. SMC90]|jgi:RimJ/RimL family protein N-acetyltransferase|uniref:GNAT family N-acetyltransferase n=1 Tax=Mucilaginibacter rubeus TaxID=2027860 RepID=A0A5C1I348_9SPHI|nr:MULTISPECIES: GNAT family protein [Mucilaginibacter]QEM12413.1 GNAT family N-acetyltransferase [Mucilaginibacter rubeus]UOE48733.1 GNAT family N-acetyltransferase [Mucilaginibacter sp. SMC90]
MTVIENDAYCIEPLAANDVLQHERLASEIYQLLSDEHTLQYLPDKKLTSLHEARIWLSTAILNFYSGRNQVHLIRSKSNGALLGVLDLIPPVVAKEHYQLAHYPFFIEFYLKGHVRGKALMTGLLPKVVKHLEGKGIRELAAVVNRRNIPAAKVLKRSGFRLAGIFDQMQDIYYY